jgi:hypothetical protein
MIKFSKKLHLKLQFRLKTMGYILLFFGFFTFTYTAVCKKVPEPPFSTFEDQETFAGIPEFERPFFELTPSERWRFLLFASTFSIIGLCCIAGSYRNSTKTSSK